MLPLPPISTLFPYTTLFRSNFKSKKAKPEVPFTPGALTFSPRAFLAAVTPCFRAFVARPIQISLPVGLKRSEEHTSELQSRGHLVCRLLLENKKKNILDTDN